MKTKRSELLASLEVMVALFKESHTEINNEGHRCPYCFAIFKAERLISKA